MGKIFSFKVKNYSSGQTDAGKRYKTETVRINPNNPKDREYYGIKPTDNIETARRKYKSFWGEDVAIIREKREQMAPRKAPQQMGFNFSSKGNLPRLLR